VLAALGLTAIAAAISVIGVRPGAGEASATRPGERGRDVFLVANAFDGTVDLFGQRSLRRVEQIDVAPDYRQCVGSATTPGDAASCVVDNQLSADGILLLNDDLRVSPGGRVLYVSRPSLGDVAAFDLRTEQMLWRVAVAGLHPDHLALSPDGTRLLVSAKSADVVEVIDTRSATIVDRFPTGDSPHGNDYSEDGELVYNGSMGRGTSDAMPCRCWLTVVDAETMDVERVIEFDQGIRPFVVTPNGSTAYIQLTLLHGFVEYSLEHERVLRTVQLPLTDETTLLDPGADRRLSTSHGIALNDDGTKICAAETVSDYVAIVRRQSLSVKGIVPVGDEPAWATSSDDGRYCFVPNRESDDVSVISYRKAVEVARIEAGDHPRRIRTARVRLR
jgi:DNA-binding beta-propeller fold protein YncE